MIEYKKTITDIKHEYNLCRRFYAETFNGNEPKIFMSCPARLELLGHHLDYVGGPTWCSTIALYDTVGIDLRTDNIITLAVKTPDTEESKFDLNLNAMSLAVNDKAIPIVFRYILSAINEFSITTPFRFPTGFNLAIRMQIPYGAGLGSSAAVSLSVIYAIAKAFNIELLPNTAEVICFNAEQALNAKCGHLDIIAELSAKEHYIGIYSPLEKFSWFLKNISYLDENKYKFLLIDFHQPHANIKQGLNNLVLEHKEILEKFKKNLLWYPFSLDDSLCQIIDTTLFSNKLEFLTDREKQLVNRIHKEKQLVEALKLQISSKSLTPKSLGNLINQSFKNSLVLGNVSKLQQSFESYARRIKGVLGVKAHGAGFGGAMLMLVNPKKFNINDLEILDSAMLGLNVPEYSKLTVYEVNLANGIIHQTTAKI